MSSIELDGFVSAPIKLAAAIHEQRRPSKQQESSDISWCSGHNKRASILCSLQNRLRPRSYRRRVYHQLSGPLLLLPIILFAGWPPATLANHILPSSQHQQQAEEQQVRHQSHYINIVPSSHFSHQEGRHAGNERAARADLAGLIELAPNGAAPDTSHIYKRSSALISSPGGSHLPGGSNYQPLVGASNWLNLQGELSNPLSRRMMSEAAHTRWTSPQMVNQEEPSPQDADLFVSSSQGEQQQQLAPAGSQQQPKRREPREEAELLRQKQHIQYHDQWPSMAGNCHKRTLNFCASVLPFNATTFPNIIGDTNRFELKRSLPFFGFLAKSGCNKRLDELLCLLLEPPCQLLSGSAIPPCKKFCRLALEGCNEYIPATLAMSSVFDCRQYPDSNDPNVCINLAQGSKCSSDEFKCPDKTCIPRNWLCDGVRDCIFAADEANCTALTGTGLQTSVCSTEEFKCDGKCVPKAWKCDGERDCLDGSDEESCDQRPRCGPDRFKCADGNGCIPKRWVCDGKAECRDGSDEIGCEQRQCSESDFKCGNGICIPKLWRCDHQFDCKDGSDEHGCSYPTTNYSTTSSATTTTAAALITVEPTTEVNLQVSGSNLSIVRAQEADQALSPMSYYSGIELENEHKQRLESNLNEDISRIIQAESSSTTTDILDPTVLVTVQQQVVTVPPAGSNVVDIKQPSLSQQMMTSKEMKKFDYDLIPNNQGGYQQTNELSTSEQSRQMHLQQHQPQLATQIDYVPQRQAQGHQKLQQQVATVRASEQPLSGQKPTTPNERVPIYRSLFKTLKGNQGRVSGLGQQAPQRYSVSRRRRDRIQPVSNPQVRLNEQNLSSSVSQRQHQDSLTGVHSASPSLVSTNDPGLQLQRTGHHTVASYLQLLNNRYNLRLPRVSPLPV